MRSITQIFRGERSRAPLTISTMILLSAASAAQKPVFQGTSSGEAPTVTIFTGPKNKLVFPYGVQSFEKKENLKVGNEVSVLPGWNFRTDPSMVGAIVSENPNGFTRPGTQSRRWLAVDDLGAGPGEGFTTPLVQAPSPWNYSWSFAVQAGNAPASSIDAPVLAVQHLGNLGMQDAWGVRLTPTGAELFTTAYLGSEQVAPLFSWGGTTDLGQWIEIRVAVSLQKGTVEAFVNNTQVALLRSRAPDTTDVTRLRFAYHGGGPGNSTSMLLDDLTIAFGGPVCEEDLNLDFTTEDDLEIALANGQEITDPPEFGEKLTITGSGANRGAAIFDSTNPGPNSASQDPDLLVNQGNVLILQNDAATNPPAVADIYPRPNDDENGGTFQFNFLRPLRPLSIDVIDIDAASVEGVTITLTDFGGDTRVFTIPADWTGDITLAQPGVGTLDLTDPNPQAGFNSIATSVSSGGYEDDEVVSMTVEMGGSGALDNFIAKIPCVLIDFESEDDATPDAAGTTLANGQDISDPPEFGTHVSISGALGNHVGPAIFESSSPGVNDFLGAPDRDLCVGLGNVLILQNNNFSVQTTSGFFDIPNDDTEGGRIIFDFVAPTVKVNKIDLIDVDEEESVGITVTLEDLGGNLRVYTVPIGWTEDRLNDGPPGFRTLDLTTLAPQIGYDPPGPPPAAVATGVDIGAFDPDEVVEMRVDLGGAQAVDNICFCP